MILTTGSLCLLTLSQGILSPPVNTKIQNASLIPYVSPTLHYDPWKNYDDELINKINNELLKNDIEKWDP